MSENFLLIGLGGTGCAVVRELKKNLYVEWRSRGNSGTPPEVYTFEEQMGARLETSKVATLSIDSNKDDLEGQGEKSRKWSVFGKTLTLGDREKVLISPTGIRRITENLSRYQGVEPWIKNELEFVEEITRGCSEPAGCNQIRRMGRLALANGKNIGNVLSSISDRLSELSSNGGDVGAEIHIACTFAAGTGSGTVLDVVAQLQRYLQSQPGDFNVYIHGFVTARDVGAVNAGNFYANQYGVLTELNAFRLENYRPWDIATPPRPERLQVSNTFKSVALISETTEDGKSVSFEQQIANVAEFIFQLAVRQMGNIPEFLRKSLTAEDRKDPADSLGGNRSLSFTSYGVQRVAIPEKEIREKLAYSFARQVVLKIVYNNWDGCFLPNARSFSANDFVDRNRAQWRVSREHLFLDKVEEALEQKQHPLYKDEWRTKLQQEEDRVRRLIPDNNTWLDKFDEGAEQIWTTDFRSVGTSGGAEDYFKNRRDRDTLRARARDLRAVIEENLLNGMESGDQEYVLYHLPDVLKILIKRIKDDRDHFGDLISGSQNEMEKADNDRKGIKEQYRKCGSLTHLLFKNKINTLFDRYQETSFNYYHQRTIALAAQYGQEFCAALINELRSLSDQVIDFRSRMLKAAENFKGEMDSRIIENEDKTNDEDIDYLVDVKSVNETIHKRFECDRSIQDSHAKATLEALARLRQNRAEFGAYIEIIPVHDDSEQVGGPLVDELRRVADQSAIEQHRNIRTGDSGFHGIFGQNIIKKLYNDYGGQVSDEMRHWLRELMAKAMPMISFDANEEHIDLGGKDTRSPILRRFVFVPRCKDVPQQFSQELKEAIQSIRGELQSGGVVEVPDYHEIPEDRNSSEITILSVAYFFPARFTRTVQGLQEQYLKRLDQPNKKDAQRAYFEVHTESHSPRLPNLMKQGRAEVLAERFATVLLVTALELMWIPDNDEQILFGTEEAYNTGGDMVESGLSVSAELREKAESHKKKNEKISLEITILHFSYLARFNENSLDAVENLVMEKMKEEIDLNDLEKRLKSFQEQSFLIAGKKRDDKTFILFQNSVNEAVEQSRRFSEELV